MNQPPQKKQPFGLTVLLIGFIAGLFFYACTEKPKIDIELIKSSADNAPTEILEYSWKPATQQQIDLVITTSQNQDELFRAELSMNMQVKNDHDSGDATLEFSFMDVQSRLLDAHFIQPSILDDIKGETIQGTITKDGAFVDIRPSEPIIELAEKQSINLANDIQSFFVPLPKVPIGKGAIWKHTQKSQERGVTMVSTIQYSLVSLVRDQNQVKRGTIETSGTITMTGGGLQGEGTITGSVELFFLPAKLGSAEFVTVLDVRSINESPESSYKLINGVSMNVTDS